MCVPHVCRRHGRQKRLESLVLQTHLVLSSFTGMLGTEPVSSAITASTFNCLTNSLRPIIHKACFYLMSSSLSL